MSDFIHGSFFDVFPGTHPSPRTDFDRLDLAPAGFLGIQCEHGHFAVPSRRGFAKYSYHLDWHHCAEGHVAPTSCQRAVLQRRDSAFLRDGWEERLLSAGYTLTNHGSSRLRVRICTGLESSPKTLPPAMLMSSIAHSVMYSGLIPSNLIPTLRTVASFVIVLTKYSVIPVARSSYKTTPRAFSNGATNW